MISENIKDFVDLLKSSDTHSKQFIQNVLNINHNNEEYYQEILNLAPDEFIIENLNLLNLNFLIKNIKLSENIINILIKDYDIFDSDHMDNLLTYQILNENLLEKYIFFKKKFVNWDLITEFQILSTKFINKYEDNLDWKIISKEQHMTLEFIIKNKTKIYWKVIPMNIKLQYLMNEGFISLFKNEDIWDNIGWLENVSIETLQKYEEYFTDKTWQSINNNMIL